MAYMVGIKGQVVIAKEIRDRLGIEPGWLTLQRLLFTATLLCLYASFLPTRPLVCSLLAQFLAACLLSITIISLSGDFGTLGASF